MSTDGKMSNEIKQFLSEMGRRNGQKGSREAKGRAAKQWWDGLSTEERRAHLAKATAASLEARRKKREAKG